MHVVICLKVWSHVEQRCISKMSEPTISAEQAAALSRQSACFLPESEEKKWNLRPKGRGTKASGGVSHGKKRYC